MTQFEMLYTALELIKAGRTDAARRLWETMLSEFRCRVIQFAIMTQSRLSAGLPIPSAVGESAEFGQFILNDSTARSVVIFAVEMTRAGTARSV